MGEKAGSSARGTDAMADLWGLVWGKPQVDPRALAEAIEREARRGDLDFRTRLLIRDGAAALEGYWGKQRWGEWLRRSRSRPAVEAISAEDLGEPGFPSLKERLMDPIDPEAVRQYLRELGTQVHRTVRLVIGGSIALILTGRLSRSTEDIDVVDEVPAELRSQHALLEKLERLYGLRLSHFQSHYLPSGWEGRSHSLEPFGRIQASVIDAHDVFLSKLFSNREKDLADLRLLYPQLDQETLLRRLRDTTARLRQEAALCQAAERNWYILTGQPLPSGG